MPTSSILHSSGSTSKVKTTALSSDALKVATMERDAAIEQAVQALAQAQESKQVIAKLEKIVANSRDRSHTLEQQLQLANERWKNRSQVQDELEALWNQNGVIDRIIDEIAKELLETKELSTPTQLHLEQLKQKFWQKLEKPSKPPQTSKLELAYAEILTLNQQNLALQEEIRQLQLESSSSANSSTEQQTDDQTIHLFRQTTADFQQALKTTETHYEMTIKQMKQAHAIELQSLEKKWIESFKALQSGYESIQTSQGISGQQLQQQYDMIEQLQSDLTEANGTIQTLQKTILDNEQSHKQTLLSIQQAYTEENQESTATLTELTAKMQRLKEFEDQCQEFQQTIQHQTLQVTQLQQENHALQQQLSVATSSDDVQQPVLESIQRLQEENQTLQYENETLQRETKELRQVTEALGRENESEREEKATLRRANEDLGQGKQDLEMENGRLQRENETLRMERADLREQQEALTREYSSLQQEKEEKLMPEPQFESLQEANSKLRQEKQSLQQLLELNCDDLESLKLEKAGVEEKVVVLKQEHQALLQKLETKNKEYELAINKQQQYQQCQERNSLLLTHPCEDKQCQEEKSALKTQLQLHVKQWKRPCTNRDCEKQKQALKTQLALHVRHWKRMEGQRF